MIKRTLYFGNAVRLRLRHEQLLIEYKSSGVQKKVPIEDIGVMVVDHAEITYSHQLMSKLLGNNVALVTCDAQHLPQGMMLNLNGHKTQQEHFRVQINASEAVKKRLWKQTVQAKIRNQAAVLARQKLNTENMEYWARQVNPGDPQNYEGRAAAFYWRRLFQDYISGFTRGRFDDAPNNLLNYGYAILRATVARSLIASGLLPTFGIHHHNRYNAYCLADDVMEPYRPFVDQLVLTMVADESFHEDTELTTEIKSQLLKVPVLDVQINGRRSPLLVAVSQTTSSLYQCLSKERKEIKYPEF